MAYDTAGSLLVEYVSFCREQQLPFEQHLSLAPPDDSTLFCIAGMQRYKELFRDPSHRGTLANVQRCLRLDDLDELGDGHHWLSFDMLGLFSFHSWSLERAIDFWWAFLDRIGIAPDVVTIHPDRASWARHHAGRGATIQADAGCTWSDGDVSGYCTEFFVGGVELGNVVNPLGDCIDAGFGLERLALVLGQPPPEPGLALLEATQRLIDEGFMPSNKRQGYVLRRLLRRLVREGIGLEHPLWHAEAARQARLQERYARLRQRHPDHSAQWWWQTHGIDLDEVDPQG